MPHTTEQVLQALREVPTNEQRLSKGDWTLSNGTASDRSLVADYKARRPLAVDPSRMAHLALVTHEQYTTDGTGGNTETFALSQDLVDAGSTAEPVVAFLDGSATTIDAVRYDTNEIDVTDPDTNSTLDVFYAVGPGDQCKVEFVKRSPKKNTAETLWSGDVSLLNARDQAKEGLHFDLSRSPFQAVVPRNWTLELYTEGGYGVAWDAQTQGATATNALLSVPIRRTQAKIEDLNRVVRHDVASV